MMLNILICKYSFDNPKTPFPVQNQVMNKAHWMNGSEIIGRYSYYYQRYSYYCEWLGT